METRIDFLTWLSKKLYLTNVGLYATIIVIMVLPKLFIKTFEISPAFASFAAFFIVAFVRAAYDSVVIYETPVKSLSLHKMSILSLVTSVVMAFVAAYLRPMLGYFSIPVALIISMIVVGKLKEALWPSVERPGFLHELPAKLDINKKGTYCFYAILVGIAYIAINKYGVSFVTAFSTAFFIGMMLEEFYTMTKVYDQNITSKMAFSMIVWSASCAIVSTAIVMFMMKYFGFAGQAATIASVVLIKLIQPLGSRKLILGVDLF